MKVGITGGIGTGKSYVGMLLRQRGIGIYDCDAGAKRLMLTDSKLRQQLKSLIGPEAYLSSGSLDKSVVAQFLLASEHNARQIDHIVHPAVVSDFLASGLLWVESAILFEAGLDSVVDHVVCVTAPLEVRLRRIVRRDHITREKAMQWVERQMPQDEVVRRSHYVIVNDGEMPLQPQIDRLLCCLNGKSKCNTTIPK